MQRYSTLTFPSGGCTSKNKVRFIYELAIFPKWVSSQLKATNKTNKTCYNQVMVQTSNNTYYAHISVLHIALGNTDKANCTQ